MGNESSKKHNRGHHRSNNPPVPTQSNPPVHGQLPQQPSRLQPSRLNDLSQFAVITVIFNPIQYASRYQHYHNFERYMTQSGVALYTVECIFESAPQFGLAKQTFHVTDSRNPRHIQLLAPSIFWIKENLINIAVNQLPEHIRYIAWIDADIEFDNSQWPHLTIDALERYPIVQLFELSYFLGPNGKNQILRRDYSFGYSIRNNKVIDPTKYDEWYAHPGYAWAMRRQVYNQMGGLLDFCIIGSGDLHFAFALLGRIEETIRPQMHPDYQSLAIQWGAQLAQLADYGEKVGYVPINLYHFWHGDRDRRHYVSRWGILEKYQFSPLTDLEKENRTGLIRLVNNSNRGEFHGETRLKALERDIVGYFKSREEDSREQRNIPREAAPPIRGKPAGGSKAQPSRSGGRMAGLPSKITSHSNPTRRPIWSSGPSGTHVDDDHSYCDPCICPGHIHCPDNHHCPCPPDHIVDHHDHHHHHHHENDHHHHENDHHHHENDHHHHENDHHYHHSDESHCWNPTDDHSHHDSHGWGTSDHNYTDYSSGGGPGSFY